MAKDLAIALVSGGMDSLLSLGLACERHRQVAVLHLSYGQRTQDKELSCFLKIADHYNIAPHLRKVVELPFLKDFGGSSLTDSKIEVARYSGDSLEIPSSYVPFRNTILISVAVAWAEVLEAKKVYIGAVAEDSSGYPDCRPDYYRALNALVKEGTKGGDIEVVTPLIDMSKVAIVEKALEIKAPLEHSWSCYKDSKVACGVCDSCTLRLRGFERAGAKDPIPYA